MIAEPLEKMPTSLEALSNEHLQEQATKARFAACILHAYFLAQRSQRPERAQPVVAPIKIGRVVPLWQRQEVEAMLLALTPQIETRLTSL